MFPEATGAKAKGQESTSSAGLLVGQLARNDVWCLPSLFSLHLACILTYSAQDDAEKAVVCLFAIEQNHRYLLTYVIRLCHDTARFMSSLSQHFLRQNTCSAAAAHSCGGFCRSTRRPLLRDQPDP